MDVFRVALMIVQWLLLLALIFVLTKPEAALRVHSKIAALLKWQMKRG